MQVKTALGPFLSRTMEKQMVMDGAQMPTTPAHYCRTRKTALRWRKKIYRLSLFHKYLYGRHFTVIDDHQLIKAIYNNPSASVLPTFNVSL